LLDKTIVIITSDHGELLGENGARIGHGWAVNPQLANIPLIVMDPAKHGYHVNRTIGSQVDLLPSILDLLGIPVPDGQLYQGRSLYSSEPDVDRTIFLSSFNDYGIIRGQHFFYGDRMQQGEKEALIGAETENSGRVVFDAAKLPSIPIFDAFQESFLQYYSQYCELLK